MYETMTKGRAYTVNNALSTMTTCHLSWQILSIDVALSLTPRILTIHSRIHMRSTTAGKGSIVPGSKTQRRERATALLSLTLKI